MSKTIKSSARNMLFRLISSYPHELNEVQKNRREINASLATIENIAGEIQDIEKKNDLKNALLSLRIKLLPRVEYTEKKTSEKCVFSNRFTIMGLATVIESETHFQAEMAAAGTKLVVADFTATWCPPCQRIAPIFEQLPAKFPRAVFLKVDVDRCAETAGAQGVSAMPTFIFYRNRTKIDRLQGADPATLESKVRQHYGSDDSGEEDTTVAGHMDLSIFISKSECECLNESDDHPFTNALTAQDGYLESDCDEQLIISLTFNQSVKLHSLKMKAPGDKGPKFIKLFINQPRTLDFDQASGNVAVQELDLSPSDLEGNPVPLKFVKFQNVQNIQVFVKDNQAGGDVTRIDHLAFYGSPISTTNMGDFKRIAGKKGESH